MWVEYRGPLSTVYNDGEISTCGWIIEVHSVQSTMMGKSEIDECKSHPLSVCPNVKLKCHRVCVRFVRLHIHWWFFLSSLLPTVSDNTFGLEVQGSVDEVKDIPES